MKRFGIKKPDGLSEWEFFVWRHRGAGNILFHFTSYVLFILIVWVTIARRNAWLLLLLPPSQYIGFLGHQLFEEGGARSKDLLSPVTSFYLAKIFFLVAIGKYKPEIARVQRKLEGV